MENELQSTRPATKAAVLRSEQAYREALRDVQAFTSKQSQACKVDLERLRNRVAAVLGRPDIEAQNATPRHWEPELPRFLGTSSNLAAASQRQSFKSQSGTYPAIDRLLARKQAINKLHCLRTTSASPETSRCKNAVISCPHRQICTTDVSAKQQGDDGESGSLTPKLSQHAASGSLHGGIPTDANSDECPETVACSKPTSSTSNATAHSQYHHFKAWRQQRQHAAVIVQKYTRRFLAKQLTVQLQRLSAHAVRRQWQILAACLQAWREYACSVVSFRLRLRQRDLRYGLWQHCYLGQQFDGDSVFHSEGKAMMAVKYRQWRTKAVVMTRWQLHSTCPLKFQQASELIKTDCSVTVSTSDV